MVVIRPEAYGCVLVPPLFGVGVAGAAPVAGGVAGVAGAGVEAAGGVAVDEVVVGSVDVPPICDHTKAPTITTARIATHAIMPDLRRGSGVVRRSAVVRRSGRVSFELGS
jgi:hypothetical protein